MNPPALDPATLPLRDIHLPAGIGWWPPALGWWLLLAFVLLAIGLAWWGYQRHRDRRANRAALKLLDGAAALAEAEPLTAVQTVSVALRRFVITTEADVASASVTEDAWLELLDRRWTRDAFSQGVGRLLAQAPYLPADRVAAADARSLIELARQWLSVQRPAGA